VRRFTTSEAAASQNAASAAPSCAVVVPVADAMKDGYAECCLVEDDASRGVSTHSSG
jgi:hypothetical protein